MFPKHVRSDIAKLTNRHEVETKDVSSKYFDAFHIKISYCGEDVPQNQLTKLTY